MAEVIYADFKSRTYHRDPRLTDGETVLLIVPLRDTSPCEMPPVQPVYHAPPEDCA